MTADKLSRLWLLATGVLIIMIITGSLIIWARKGNGQPITIISPPESSSLPSDIYVHGAVTNPGTYTLQSGDSIESLLQASGGISDNADLSRMNLYIPGTGTPTPGPQKIDINRAEAWLLEALPDIGTSRARDIIEYREQNGLFRSIEEIMNVPGISQTTFDKIKNLITLTD